MNKLNFKGSAMLNPTPVVLVTCKNKEDKINVFTVGWVSTVCTKPPVIALGIRPERLSHEYIKETRECTINLPSKDMIKIVDFCGVKSGRKVDKIKHFDLKLDKGISINTPSLDKAPVALECTVKSITHLGTHDLFLCEVKNIKVDEDLVDNEGKICFNKANLICYSHGEYFALNSKPLGSFGYSVSKKSSSNRKGSSNRPSIKKSSSPRKPIKKK